MTINTSELHEFTIPATETGPKLSTGSSDCLKTVESVIRNAGIALPVIATTVIALPIAIGVDFINVLKKPTRYEPNLTPWTECIVGLTLDLIRLANPDNPKRSHHSVTKKDKDS